MTFCKNKFRHRLLTRRSKTLLTASLRYPSSVRERLAMFSLLPSTPSSRCSLVHRHAAPPDLGRGAFQVKFELHRMPPMAEQFLRRRRAVVTRETIGCGVFDMMHGPIQVHRGHEISVVGR